MLLQLFFCFERNDGLKPGHHVRVGVGTNHRADNIVGIHRVSYQSRRASFVASFNVLLPEVAGTTFAPNIFIRETFGA